MTRSKLRPLGWRVYNLAASLCRLLVQKSRTDVYRYSLASTVRRLSSPEGTSETKKPPVSSLLVVTEVSLRNPVTVGLSSNYAGKLLVTQLPVQSLAAALCIGSIRSMSLKYSVTQP